MAEFIDLSQNQDFIDEMERIFGMFDDFHDGLDLNFLPTFGEIAIAMSDEELTIMQERVQLLKITRELQDSTKNLLEVKIKLMNTQVKIYMKFLENYLWDILTKSSDYLKGRMRIEQWTLVTTKMKELQLTSPIDEDGILGIEQKSLLTILMKELLINLTSPLSEEDVQEMNTEFLKFREIYKKCKSLLENLFGKARKQLKVSNLPRCCQEHMCVLFSTFEENMASCKVTLSISRKAFNEFESLTQKELTSSVDDKCEYRINILSTAIEKASDASEYLVSIFHNILDMD